MTALLKNERDLYLAPGGPTFRLVQRLTWGKEGPQPIVRRIIFLFLVTWVPMCVFALLQGNAIGNGPGESFLLDIVTYARFAIALPILLAAEVIAAPRIADAGLHFVRDGLVRRQDYPAFERAIARLARRRESVIAELVIVAFVLLAVWNPTIDAARGAALGGWQSVRLPPGHAFPYSLAALWNYIVAMPVAIFLFLRWVWRLLNWTLFLLDVSRLELQLVASHADGAGGLGFLDVAHCFFGSLAFATATVPCAAAATRIMHHGATISSLAVHLAVLLVVTQILYLGPLLVFCPALARTRRDAVRTYGSLVIRYNQSFEEKWLGRSNRVNEPLLGSADIQSLADLGNTYRFVNDMMYTPFTRWTMLQIAFMTALPAVPLLLLVVPISEIIQLVVKIFI